jgi:NAD(P)-dependent dehydrogenase (short-subunit alcohol dehydrogenase family)
LAREVDDDRICVNAIAPGYTVTEVMDEASIHDEAFINAVVGSRSFKRNETPEGILGIVVPRPPPRATLLPQRLSWSMADQRCTSTNAISSSSFSMLHFF